MWSLQDLSQSYGSKIERSEGLRLKYMCAIQSYFITLQSAGVLTVRLNKEDK